MIVPVPELEDLYWIVEWRNSLVKTLWMPVIAFVALLLLG